MRRKFCESFSISRVHRRALLAVMAFTLVLSTGIAGHHISTNIGAANAAGDDPSENVVDFYTAEPYPDSTYGTVTHTRESECPPDPLATGQNDPDVIGGNCYKWTFTATPANGTSTGTEYSFEGWYIKNGNSLGEQVNVSTGNVLVVYEYPGMEQKSYYAKFQKTDLVTVNKIGNGDGTVTVRIEETQLSRCDGIPLTDNPQDPHCYAVTLHAIAGSDSEFSGWFRRQDGSGNATSTDNPYEFYAPLNGATAGNYYAKFTAVADPTPTYTVTVNTEDSSMGTVSIDSESFGNTVTKDIAEGQSATIRAKAKSGYEFTGWKNHSTFQSECNNGICSSIVTVTATVTYTAQFRAISTNPEPTQYTVTVTADPVAGGIVTGGGTYDSGQNVTLTANANQGYRFSHWDDDNSATNSELKISNLSSDVTHIAHFVQVHTITVETANSVMGLVAVDSGNPSTTVSLNVDHGTSVTIKAVPNEGYKFTSWDDQSVASMQSERRITVNNDGTFTASFEVVATDPTDPDDPTDPGDPTDPTDPTDPDDPTDPTDPTDPDDPTDPTDPTDPDDPDNPTDPDDPDNPTDPDDPGDEDGDEEGTDEIPNTSTGTTTPDTGAYTGNGDGGSMASVIIIPFIVFSSVVTGVILNRRRNQVKFN